MKELILPTYQDVEAASARIANFAHKTPVMTSSTINKQFGAELFFKCENFQRMGAFKFRGALNALAQFTPQQKKAGVIAFSSGNHAQGIALAAQILNIPATILMPLDAPEVKVAATEGYGASVVRFDRYTQDREQLTQELATQQGLTIIPPFDHPHIIAGQGTSAKELFEEVGELDALFVCLGGGGLLSGCALAARALSPNCKVYGVEPEAGNDAQQSFRSGKIVHIETPKTIADGAQTQHIGHYTFALIQQNVDDILTATDEQLVDCMKFYAERMKMVVEPTGCLSFAAAVKMKEELRGKRIGIIVSGGNVDIKRFAELMLA
ncbi:Phenylserine dehydratase [Providencia rustigianii]|uniref:L-threonine dehydratase catabolic TdcB n=1 Tax=Providencia rustigianii DSM 4541 TaxID=500637 RepID=D1NYT2_9GAMM|nr:threo-3-hydroxy-L-aspartate ammonia-lyase [Providencia rustigianii]EFB73630.1 pyridoxal-phosphate dependent protein [Providencia rustigianii DSM 4541]SUC27044.1 Phenylserine dehydratase [Providencia rustigianii]VEB69871.1 Phenylserine dehydratase [Providencia rustigianii]